MPVFNYNMQDSPLGDPQSIWDRMFTLSDRKEGDFPVINSVEDNRGSVNKNGKFGLAVGPLSQKERDEIITLIYQYFGR